MCGVCGGAQLRPRGVGTERVESAARRLFRGTPVHRLDATAAPDEAAQRRVWEAFGRRGGLLVGTQLLVKGVGQVSAGVVGAIGVDAGLNLPDFRAAERMYQVLGRLAALARREMIVQTFTPAHPALRALEADGATFYREELAVRARFRYPPYHTLVNVVVAAADAEAGRDLAARLASGLASGEVLGPSPAPLARVRGRHRWQVLIKEGEEMAVRRELPGVLRRLAPPRGAKVLVDVDPVEVL
jgi:primosomal protein N' (replication factor Y)